MEADDDDVETGPENDEEISSAEDTEDESGDEDDEANTVAEINRLQDEVSFVIQNDFVFLTGFYFSFHTIRMIMRSTLR